MTRPHQLDQTLRTLKLSGMLDTLDTRLAQATAGDLGHLEFLQALCEDEIARRDAHAIGRRVRAARFEQPTSLENFDFKYNPSIPAATIRDLATLRFLGAGESVILHGPVGVGKTLSRKQSATTLAATTTPSHSPKPAAYSLISPGVTPIEPGPRGSNDGPEPSSSSSTISPCVTSPSRRQMTFMNSSLKEIMDQ